MKTNVAVIKPEEPLIGKVVNCKHLDVYVQPYNNAEILGTISANSEVLIDENESTSEFYKICTVFGLEGFCMKKHIIV